MGIATIPGSNAGMIAMATAGELRSNAIKSAPDAVRRMEDLGPRFGAEVLGPGLWIGVRVG